MNFEIITIETPVDMKTIVKVFREKDNWASEASPTLGCSIEISRDIYMYVVGMSYVCRMSN